MTGNGSLERPGSRCCLLIGSTHTMKTVFVLLCWFTASKESLTPVDDDALVDFRQYLGELLQEANKNMHEVYALPDANEELTKQSDGWLSLRNGFLDNLQNMTRDGDCIVQMNGSSAVATAYVYFAEMPFSYTVTTDSTTYPNVTGHVRGELCSISGKLVILADMKNTSAVNVRVESFHLESPTVFMWNTNYTKKPGNDFAFDLSTALHEMLKTRTAQFLERRIERFIKANTLRVNLSMLPVTSTTSSQVPSTTTRHTTASSITGSSTSSLTTTNSTDHGAANASKENHITSKSTSKPSETRNVYINKESASNPSKQGSHSFISNGYVFDRKENVTNSKFSTSIKATFTQVSRSSEDNVDHVPRKGSALNDQLLTNGGLNIVLPPRNYESPRTSANITPYIVISVSPGSNSEYPPHTTIPCDVTPSRIPRRSRETVPSQSDSNQKQWLTENFNRFFDTLLQRTDHKFTNRRSYYFSLPDDEEEIYVLNDGSITLVNGDVYGLENIFLDADTLVQRNRNVANATVIVNLSNVTYSFQFSAKSKTYMNHSLVNGTVSGNLTGLRGQIIILANLTNAARTTTAVVDAFYLLPTVDFPMDVVLPANTTYNITSEISDAVIRDFKKDVVQWLQKRVVATLRHVIANLQEDASTSTQVATTTSSTSTMSTSPTLMSIPVTTPSVAANITVRNVCVLVSILHILSTLL